MKIGIITFHRANNYGAALQCYALQCALKSLNYDVHVIDYRQPDTEEAYTPVSFSRIRKEIKNPLSLLKDILLTPLRCRNAHGFNKFRKTYLNCTAPVYGKGNVPQGFDVYLLGSDQLWSILCTGGHVEEMFWGCFKKYISSQSVINGYAISGTISSLETIGKEKVKTYLENFNQLSCREEGVAHWIINNTGYGCRVDVDPTLLVESNVWKHLLQSEKSMRLTKQPFLLSYYLLPKQKPIVKESAQKHGLKYVELGHVASSPTDFLSLIKNATVIVGGSFHIAVFSIVFRKQFYIIRKESDFDIRSENLLKQLNLQERMIPISAFPDIMADNKKACYDGVAEKLQALKEKSLEYLASFNVVF